MAKPPSGTERLAQLTRERDTLEADIEDMIGAMAAVAPEERAAGEWATDGAATRRYLGLTQRQSDVEHEIAELSRALAASAPPTRPN